MIDFSNVLKLLRMKRKKQKEVKVKSWYYDR
ncbi:MAG: hypothetical protein ACI9W5_000600, partial [Ulvibacter sp.]